MEKITFVPEYLKYLYINQDEVRKSLIENYPKLVTDVFNDNLNFIYHFKGRFGGVTVNIIGNPIPCVIKMYGNKNSMKKSKRILESTLCMGLIEEKLV